MMRRPPRSTRTDTRFPYTTLFRSITLLREWLAGGDEPELRLLLGQALRVNGQLEASASELRRLLAVAPDHRGAALTLAFCLRDHGRRSEEHTSELPSLMSTSYAVYYLEQKTHISETQLRHTN